MEVGRSGVCLRWLIFGNVGMVIVLPHRTGVEEIYEYRLEGSLFCWLLS